MKRKSILILTLMLLLPLSILSYGAQRSTAPSSQEGGEKPNAEVMQLQETVKKLEARIDDLSKLQERVKTLEARVDELYRWTLHPSKKG